MKVLLTGATGFIGSHVARELLHQGHEVHAVLRPTSDHRRIRDIERSVKIYIGEMDHVPFQPDVAIHLAWYAIPGKYLTAPENHDCLKSSLRLLERLECRSIFAGTCAEYGFTFGKLSEEIQTNPPTLYAQCKNDLRKAVVARPDSSWIRFFYQYGPWEDERRLMSSVIRSLQDGKEAKVSPGDQRRDFLHIEDVASAVCAIATSSLQGIVNIGSGEAPSVKEIVTKIGDLVGRPDLIKLGALPYVPNEPMLIVADNTKLISTGWKPKYTLDSGLRHTVEWWKKQINIQQA